MSLNSTFSTYRIPLTSLSPPDTVQIVLSTAHPAKFAEAVQKALQSESSFNFDKDVLPSEFRGILEKERRVIDVEAPEVELVKKVIEKVAEKTTREVPNVSV